MAAGILEDWSELDNEYNQLDETHKCYAKKVDEVKAVQKTCMSSIAHQRYRIRQLSDGIRRLKGNCSEEELQKLNDVSTTIEERKSHLREMEDILPHENGIYLKIILGSVNVSLLSKHDKFKYKEDYEQFKLYLSIIILVLAIINWFLLDFRVTDAAFQFLLVWYYCTLTIREHILKINGSRIKGWWITHHFISTACAGVFLIWPDGYSYKEFREQFVVFSVFLSMVQLIQYYYQKGCLYRLRALGERRNMDISVEGFQSWMWKGLSFLLPFLLSAYIFQLYNAYVLFKLSLDPKCTEWQVTALSMVFLVLFTGNMLTTVSLLRQKIKNSGWMKNREFIFKNKYRFQSKNHTA